MLAGPCWMALCLRTTCGPSPAEEPAPSLAATPEALGWWALQFTPRVCRHEEAVLMEVGGSLRLFGGPQALRARIETAAAELGWKHCAAAPTALGALALARGGQVGAWGGELSALLDGLPLDSLRQVALQAAWLSRLGCRCLGQVRALPRAGLARRAGPDVLRELDQAYGEAPWSAPWITPPEVFEARLELPGRVESAPALMLGVRRLLLQLCGWLAARQAGLRCFVLRWRYDGHGRDDAWVGELPVRTAEPTRRVDHLLRLSSEWLARVRLAAPVGELSLCCDEIEPLAETASSLLPGAVEITRGESLSQLLERLSARLGPDRVCRPVPRADHRPEAQQTWQPAMQVDKVAMPSGLPGPQPAWLWREPLLLDICRERPQLQGDLRILAGPHRLEAGWWDTPGTVAARDYYVAWNERSGLVWIYRERRLRDGGSWFLHGGFG
ncbi:Y-family DNA polymerase [Caldimonas taiwanensis]|uniref:Y-family DNA polymerase n=1 Tax=Caldimonas taiwanensis TaxID=307483 RepID=UPI000785EF16|nr:DNA polymerase Y family protein [Caldimonas taiwanensis]